MHRTLLLLGLLASLSACGDGQPLFEEPDDGGGELPPGTDNPDDESGILRYEGTDGEGGGFVQDVAYDRESDTFFVDNLAFDGDNVYSRDDDVRRLASYRVYEGDERVRDPEDGDAVNQFQYRAIYGESDNRDEEGVPRTRFAIVRTGAYVDYGFGGFVYERDGGVDLPTTGQATYAGDYAGVRTFDGLRGLEYTTGDVEIAIDFRDFNEGEGVRGTISDRRAFDEQGNEIELTELDANGNGVLTAGELILPDLVFDVGPGTIAESGEMSNGIGSQVRDEDGSLEDYETGTYYAIVAGPNADEVVGVFVVESDDPRYGRDIEGPDVVAQETGGFIVYR